MTIAIDFDGTCVTHEYPETGRDVGAVKVLKTLVDNGHKLILLTMRSGETLENAKKWFSENNIELYGCNENPSQKRWTQSPKVFANLYIDDANLGCPLARTTGIERPYVDWKYVILELEKIGVILPENVPSLMKSVIESQEDLALFQ